MKRFLPLLFTVLLLSAVMCVSASASSYDSVAEELSAIGMFRGTENGFELDRTPTRSEAAIMLVRLYGAEEAAKAAYEAGEISHPFTDVSDFTSPYVAWLYANGITNGFTETTYASQRTCTAQNYVVFLLRALGYKDGTDFQYAEAMEFGITRGLFDLSFFSGSFLRDHLAAVTYQALACNLADGSTYLLDSLIDSGVIDAKAAKSITEKIEHYRTLSAATIDTERLDAEVSMAMDMGFTMNMDGATPEESSEMEGTAALTAEGSIQMILEEDLQMGVELDLTIDYAMEDHTSGEKMAMAQPMSMGLWIKDGWMYVQQAETLYKQDISGSMGEFITSYQEIMAQLSELNGMSAMMMPYIDTITAEKQGSSTVYTMTLNQEVYQSLFDDIMDMALASMGEEALLDERGVPALDMSLSNCSYTYTIDSKGQLKDMAAVMDLSMAMDMSEEGYDASITFSVGVDMDMAVNSTGSKVKVDYPDLTQFPDMDSLYPETSGNSAEDSTSFPNR